jgi:redox-regulated HSP33 family molecular chaperone
MENKMKNKMYRVNPTMWELLQKKAYDETVKRGKVVTASQLITEQLKKYVKKI